MKNAEDWNYDDWVKYSDAAEKAGYGKGADKKADTKATAGKISEGASIISGALDTINQKLNPMNAGGLREAYGASIGKEYKGSKGGPKGSSQKTSTTKDDEFKENTSPLSDADMEYQVKSDKIKKKYSA
tara:strand:+ start:181 stop:567 length:387 start_codon:yes stop_codon:yes gene_type:complete